jgi:hypothetical protein
VARPLGSGGDEELGRCDDLVAARVVLADPRLVVAQLVHPLDERHVARQGARGVLVDRVEGGDEGAEAQTRRGHGTS